MTQDALSRYCTRLESPSFWGGEVEILILSKMLRVPIHVMQKAQEVGRCDTLAYWQLRRHLRAIPQE